jgi:hypothetical protein
VSTTSDEPGEASRAISAFIDAMLADEQARKTSVEQRGISAITSSAAVVTIIGGLSTFAVVGEHARLNSVGKAAALAAIGLFVLAAAGGVIANLPLGYSVGDVGAIPQTEPANDSSTRGGIADQLRPEIFWGPARAVQRRHAEVRVVELRTLRASNSV